MRFGPLRLVPILRMARSTIGDVLRRERLFRLNDLDRASGMRGSAAARFLVEAAVRFAHSVSGSSAS